MCERTCPNCGSTDHFSGYGIAISYINCTSCFTMLCWRVDEEAAPISLNEEEADQWVKEHRGILPGAEAKDPKDDIIWH